MCHSSSLLAIYDLCWNRERAFNARRHRRIFLTQALVTILAGGGGPTESILKTKDMTVVFSCSQIPTYDAMRPVAVLGFSTYQEGLIDIEYL